MQLYVFHVRQRLSTCVVPHTRTQTAYRLTIDFYYLNKQAGPPSWTTLWLAHHASNHFFVPFAAAILAALSTLHFAEAARPAAPARSFAAT
jgi:hypothetical protein